MGYVWNCKLEVVGPFRALRKLLPVLSDHQEHFLSEWAWPWGDIGMLALVPQRGENRHDYGVERVGVHVQILADLLRCGRENFSPALNGSIVPWSLYSWIFPSSWPCGRTMYRNTARARAKTKSHACGHELFDHLIGMYEVWQSYF